MSIEAMKLALDALNDAYAPDPHPAIDALQQAIEAAEKQEPVAWVQDVEFEQLPEFAFSWVKTRLHDKPLYTHPPKREWVSLTDDDIYSADCVKQKYIGSGEYVIDSDSVEAFARAIDAKLREKNG